MCSVMVKIGFYVLSKGLDCPGGQLKNRAMTAGAGQRIDRMWVNEIRCLCSS